MRQYTLPQLNCNTAATLNPSQHSVNPSLGLEPPLTRFGRLSVAFSIFVRFGRVGTPLNFRQCESRMLHPAFMCNDIFILFTLTNTQMHKHTHTQAHTLAATHRYCVQTCCKMANTFWPCEKSFCQLILLQFAQTPKQKTEEDDYDDDGKLDYF